MSKYGGLYGGAYLKAVDLKNEYTPVVLTDIRPEAIKQQGNAADRSMLCVGFRGAAQRLILNTTNYNTLLELLGENEDAWEGHKVKLWRTTTEYSGKMVPCIRVVQAEQTAPPPGQTLNAAPAAPNGPPTPVPPSDSFESRRADALAAAVDDVFPGAAPPHDDDDAPPFL